MICYYLPLGVLTMLVFMAAETRWPCPRFEPLYPNGRAYRSRVVWLAGLVYALVWPIYWLCVFPDLFHTRNGRNP